MTIKSITVNTETTLAHAVAVRDYIVSVIDFEGTASEKLKFFFETFDAEYGYNVPRVGLQKAVQHYLQGLPSTINIEFEDYKIIPLLLKWGYINQQDIDNDCQNITGKLDIEIDNYWKYIAMALVVMGRRNKVIS